MPTGVVLERATAAAGVDLTWARSTVHEFFRQTNWENRPIEPPRPKSVSPYELTVRQFFGAVDWQWQPSNRPGSNGFEANGFGANGFGANGLGPSIENLLDDDPDGTAPTHPGPDAQLSDAQLSDAQLSDESLTLDGFTDLF
jgi:hypothetical protein